MSVSIQLTMADVARAGGDIEAALTKYCKDDSDVACGVIGSAFSTSGPGPGWSTQHDVSDFARRALDGEYGATSYLDVEDGRLATLVDDDDDEEPQIEWTEDSVVEMVCPDIEEAIDDPKILAVMAAAALGRHRHESDQAEWKSLIRRIRAAAEAIEDVPVD